MHAQGGWRTQLALAYAVLGVSQASGLLLVLLDQDYQANTPPPCAHASTVPVRYFLFTGTVPVTNLFHLIQQIPVN